MGVEIDNEVYAALQTLGQETAVDLARHLVRARCMHPVFARSAEHAGRVVLAEAAELMEEAGVNHARAHAEALDVVVTGLRFMGREWGLESWEGEDAAREDVRRKLCGDAVNHPAHYTSYPVEVIDMIHAVLGDEGFKAYCLGNEIKYRMRAGLKGYGAEDLAKAMKYKEFRDAVA